MPKETVSIPNKISYYAHLTLTILANNSEWMTVKEVIGTQGIKYHSIKGALEYLERIQFIYVEKEPYNYRYKIKRLGEKALILIKNGEMTVSPLKAPNKLPKKESFPEPLAISHHNDLAAKYISETALPVAVNSDLCVAIDHIIGIAGDLLENHPEIPVSVPYLDKSNKQMHDALTKIHNELQEIS